MGRPQPYLRSTVCTVYYTVPATADFGRPNTNTVTEIACVVHTSYN